MNGLEIPAQVLVVYALVFVRFVAIIETGTLFRAISAPAPFKFFFAAVLAMACVPSVKIEVPLVLFDSWLSIALLATREFFIGMVLGLLAFLPLTALHIAGDQTGTAMGLSMASVMDPLSNAQVSIVGQLQIFVGFWFYFHWNGHLLMVQSVIESLRLVPPTGLSFFVPSDMNIGQWLTELFKLAIRMLIPFYCSVLLADVGLGFLARTVPQMNIFVLGMPLKIGLGMFVLVAVFPYMIDVLYENMERYFEFALASITAFRIVQ